MKIVFLKLLTFTFIISFAGLAFGDMFVLYLLLGSFIKLSQLAYTECTEVYRGF